MTLTDPVYRTLVATGQEPGIVGRTEAREANKQRRDLGGSPSQVPRWTAARIELWRDHAVDHLDTVLLQPGPPPDQPADRARTVLALADTAVRDAWLIRYAHADPTAQARAADRLAHLTDGAPAEYRVAVGTVRALTEWTQGRPDAAQHLADVVHQTDAPYTLAALVEGMIRARVEPRDFMVNVLGALSEDDCRTGRHPNPSTVQTAAAAGQAMTQRGWALHVQQQTDLGHTLAWSGTLTRHGAPAAHVADHGDGTRLHVHWPHGSPHQQQWTTDLTAAAATADVALAGLEHTATITVDPLALDPLQQPGPEHGPHTTAAVRR